MKISSPLFDRIRVKPSEDRRVRPDSPGGDWPGCSESATHRAPKGRLREGEYWRFCLHHVRQYNQSYNFFAGMSEDAVARYQKEAITGHRPTWKMGLNGRPMREAHASTEGMHFVDPFGVFRDLGIDGPWRPETERPVSERRNLRNAERKAFDTLGLEADASATDIKARFKMLVKRHHPDANGGDRSYEERL